MTDEQQNYSEESNSQNQSNEQVESIPKDQVNHIVQTRMNEKNSQLEQAKQYNQQLEQRLAQLEQNIKGAPQGSEDYAQQKVQNESGDWVRRDELQNEVQNFYQKQQEAAQKEQLRSKLEKTEDNLRKKYSDYDEVYNKNQNLLQMLQNQQGFEKFVYTQPDVAPELTYQLLQNDPAKIGRILNEKDPYEQFAQLKLAAKQLQNNDSNESNDYAPMDFSTNQSSQKSKGHMTARDEYERLIAERKAR